MDDRLAVSLASSIDPKTLASLQNRNNDPAVAKAVAGQFGAFLMQGMMQEGDGTALSMTGGTGGPAVNAMFAGVMSRYAMSGDKLGLADMIYRSAAGKTQPAAPAPSDGGNTAAATSRPEPSQPASGMSLTPYRLGNGRRPLGPPIGHMAPPAGVPTGVKAASAPGQAGARTAPSRATTLPVASGAGKSGAAPPTHAADASVWDWLGVPALLHFIFSSGGTPNPAGTGAQPAPPQAAAGVTAPPSGDPSPIPHGLPWTHRGPETGAPNRERTATTGAATDAESFAENLAPAIEQAARRLGVSPRILLAQAALETGWGHSVVGNNIFGIKAGASWSGATVAANTHEMTGGRLVAHRDSFRSYDSVGQAVDDYVALVSASDRYRSALGAGDDAAAYARALTGGGYATDRDYAAKLSAVADSPTMSDAVAVLNQQEPGRLVSAQG
jgi:flagellar protein FlgJ